MQIADGGGGAYDVVRVQIASLEDYAAELAEQIQALADRKDAFSPHPAFGGGGFAEAAGLGQRHDAVLKLMRTLLGQVQEGIATGQAAAQEIAAKYQGTDAFAAARLADVTAAMGPEGGSRG